jgi:hypothetical protein
MIEIMLGLITVNRIIIEEIVAIKITIPTLKELIAIIQPITILTIMNLSYGMLFQTL